MLFPPLGGCFPCRGVCNYSKDGRSGGIAMLWNILPSPTWERRNADLCTITVRVRRAAAGGTVTQDLLPSLLFEKVEFYAFVTPHGTSNPSCTHPPLSSQHLMGAVRAQYCTITVTTTTPAAAKSSSPLSRSPRSRLGGRGSGGATVSQSDPPSLVPSFLPSFLPPCFTVRFN